MAAGIWDGGGTDNKWTTAANWAGDVAPVAGADLIFAAGAPQTLNENDFPVGFDFSAILIAGSNYSLSGNAIDLTGSVTSSGSSNSFAIPVTLGSSGGFSHTGNGTFTVSSAIENNGYTLNLSATSGITLLSGIISGTGNITTGGSGTTALAAANTYSGTTTVTGGTLAVRHSQALGAATGVAATGTVVTSQSATVQLENGVSVGNELLSSTAETFGWDLRSTGANLTNSWDGNITSASNFEIRPTTNNRLNLNGTVSTASSSLYKFDSG
ncbi:MAG: autotransporter-associated beta strand repeat-containing protein, partial [Phycisphaerae bacterium]